MTIKQAIVLLYPPYNNSKDETTASIAARCKENNLAIIDMITIEDQ